MAESHLDEIEALEAKLDEIRRKFDLFFLGSKEQRVPPTVDKDALAGRLRRLREEATKWNTSERFRLQQLHQRLTSYSHMWLRGLQQVEAGTHRRDRYRLAQMRKREEESAAAEEVAAVPRPAVTTPKREEGLSDVRLKQIYETYVQAKRQTGETSTLTMDGLRAQLEKQIPAIKAKHNCQSVDFKVVLKDGKAMLKAIPR